MDSLSVGSERLPAAAICELAGVSQSKYLKWRELKLVREPSPAGCSLADCIELALANALVRALKRLASARIALRQLVDGLDSLPDVGPIDVIYEPRYGTARWVYEPTDLAAFARRYTSILVIDLRPPVDDIRRGFARRVEERAARHLHVVKAKPA